jgi:hypothetical protein
VQAPDVCEMSGAGPATDGAAAAAASAVAAAADASAAGADDVTVRSLAVVMAVIHALGFCDNDSANRVSINVTRLVSALKAAAPRNSPLREALKPWSSDGCYAWIKSSKSEWCNGGTEDLPLAATLKQVVLVERRVRQSWGSDVQHQLVLEGVVVRIPHHHL